MVSHLRYYSSTPGQQRLRSWIHLRKIYQRPYRLHFLVGISSRTFKSYQTWQLFKDNLTNALSCKALRESWEFYYPPVAHLHQCKKYSAKLHQKIYSPCLNHVSISQHQTWIYLNRNLTTSTARGPRNIEYRGLLLFLPYPRCL